MNPRPDPFNRTLSYLHQHVGPLIVAFFSAALVGLFTTADAKILQILIDDVLAPKNYGLLKIALVILLAVHILRGLFLFTSRYLVSRIGHRISRQIREELFRKVEALPLSYFEKNRSGQILARMSSDVPVVQGALMMTNTALTHSLTVFFCLALMCWLSWKLALFSLILLPVISTVVRWLSRRLRRVGSLMQERVGDLTASFSEAISGIREIQAFGAEEHQLNRFRQVNQAGYEAFMKGTKYTSLTSPIVELFYASGMALVIWAGARTVISGGLTVGQLVEFLACLGMMFHPLRSLTEIQATVKQSLGAAERIYDLLDEPLCIESRPGAPALVSVKGKVEYRGVSFDYGGENPVSVLFDIDLCLLPGQVAALVGKSGAGKTTLVNLLPRFHDATKGGIYIDEVDIRAVDLKSLRSFFGIVPQETFLFSGTIEENIALGKPGASSEEIRCAATDANAMEFIARLPEGFATVLGERGVNLSGGQRQRVAIARALLKDPKILILDEATSALDTESEALVQDALNRLMQNRTTLVIAHRLSTVAKADQIVVLEAGTIRETGTHGDLIALGGLYHHLCKAQVLEAPIPSDVS